MIFEANKNVTIKVRVSDDKTVSAHESLVINIKQEDIPNFLNIATFDVDTRDLSGHQTLTSPPKWEKRYKIIIDRCFFVFKNLDVAKKYFNVLVDFKNYKDKKIEDIYPELFI